MAEGQPERMAEVAARSLLFITRQQLLAEAVGRVIVQAAGSWSLLVLAHDHPDLLDAAVAAAPAVIVVDVDTHVIPGIDLISHLVERLPATSVVVLGDLNGAQTAEAISRGARGCLSYSVSPDEVRDAVEAAASGRVVGAAAALRSMLRGAAHPECAAQHDMQLSDRQRDILARLVAGDSTRRIAEDLGISVQTVRKHTQNILDKLGVHSKLQAAAVAVRDGLV